MHKKICGGIFTLAALIAFPIFVRGGGKHPDLKPEFQTSDRCIACHNGLKTKSGEDISIGFDWRASLMANSARDPYWQASVRRESADHPESMPAIEHECSTCHMPVSHLEAKTQGVPAQVFAHLPFNARNLGNAAAEDGVTCSVCHQIAKEKLGTRESFNGAFMIATPEANDQRPEYGPFFIDAGHQRVMQSSTGGFVPTEAAHIRDSALCGTCHTLYTQSLGPGGKETGAFPEQMPYLEWLHSDYPARSSCQSCHMPEVPEAVPVTAIFGEPRAGMRRHEFVAGNFFMQQMLNKYRDDLSVAALPQELTTAAARTIAFLQTKAARVTIRSVESSARGVSMEVLVENLSGHKLPTAYPSRRAWLHVTVRDGHGKTVFESGALNPDGSIQGNDNDADPLRFEPHYREITSPEQVQIYEPILKDSQGRVTTGLLYAVGYLKDNRILPTGFNKQTAAQDIAVIGDAASDANFTDAGSLVRYVVAAPGASGPLRIETQLMYQPIGFRWAHNLGKYGAAEPQRFSKYYDSMRSTTAVVLASAEITR